MSLSNLIYDEVTAIGYWLMIIACNKLTQKASTFENLQITYLIYDEANAIGYWLTITASLSVAR